MEQEFKNIVFQTTKKQITTYRDCAAMFGMDMGDIATIWNYIATAQSEVRPKHLLWALYFRKVYPTDVVGSTSWNTSTKTWRLRIKLVLNQLNLHLPDVIKFNDSTRLKIALEIHWIQTFALLLM